MNFSDNKCFTWTNFCLKSLYSVNQMFHNQDLAFHNGDKNGNLVEILQLKPFLD